MPGAELVPYAGVPTGAVPHPQAVYHPHPLLAGQGRRAAWALLEPGETLAAYFARQGWAFGRAAGAPVVVRVQGLRVPEAMWSRCRPRPGQLIEVQAVAEGGNGGGSKVLRTVLILAVTYFTMGAGSAWIASYGFAAQVGAYVAGVLLVNALVPVKADSLSTARDGASSPTYSLTGTQNRARPYEPLPYLFGTHKIVPDLGAAQYTEFEGDDQYLYAIFHFGIATPGYEVHGLKIGDTDITSYSDVQWQWSGDSGRLTLAAGNVDSLAGAELTNAAGWITRTSSEDAVALALDIEGSLYRAGNSGTEALSVTLEAEYRAVGASEWIGFFGGGVETHDHYWSKGYWTGESYGSGTWVQVGYDNNLASGAHVDGSIAQIYTVGSGDDAGMSAFYWRWRPASDLGPSEGHPTLDVPIPASSKTIVNGSTAPLRLTYRRDVAQDQYEVRMRRTSADETSSTNISSISWSTLRTYQADTADYNGQLRLAVRIRASGQLSSQLDSLRAEGQRMTWIWNGGTWLYQYTSNPAWWFLHFARGVVLDNRLVVGMGLDDSKIDFAALKAWGAWCTAHGLTFDAVLDTARTKGEVLDAIASCGRATKTWQSGKLGVIWDADALPITGVIGVANMRASSFKVSYATGELADEIVCTFVNAENDYTQEQVRVLLPDVVSPVRSKTVELWGVTSQARAAEAANLLAGEIVYRRKQISWQMDMEGAIHQRGDVVALSHDVTAWGYSGRLAAVSGTAGALVLTLDREVLVEEGAPASGWVGVRIPGETGYRVLTAALTDARTLTLTQAWPVDAPLPGVARPVMDHIWLYDADSTPGYRVKIIKTVPRTAFDTVEFTAVPDDPAYYASASGAFTPVAPASLLNLAAQISDLVVTEELVRVGDAYYVDLTVTFSANKYFNQAEVRGAPIAGTTPSRIGFTGTRRFTWRAYAGPTWQIEVRAFNMSGHLGNVLTAEYTIAGLSALPPAAESLAVSAGTDCARRVSIALPDALPLDIRGFELRTAAGDVSNWDTMTWFDDGVLTQADAGRTVVVDYDEPPEGTWSFAVKLVDAQLNKSASAVFASNLALGPQPVDASRSYNLLKNSHWTEYTGTNDGIGALKDWIGFVSAAAPSDYSYHRSWQSHGQVGRNIQPGGMWMEDGASGTGFYQVYQQGIPCIVGQEYEASFIGQALKCKGDLRLEFKDSSGNVLAGTPTDSWDAGTGALGATANDDPSKFQLWWCKGVAPAGAVTMGLVIRKFPLNAGSPANSYLFANHAYLGPAPAGVTRSTRTPWSNTGVSQLHGGGLITGSVGTTGLAADAATDIVSTTVGSVTITQDEQSLAHWTPNTVATLSYTPPVACDLLITATGYVSATLNLSGNERVLAGFSTLTDGAEETTWGSWATRVFENSAYSPGNTVSGVLMLSKRVSDAPAGVAQTWRLKGTKLNNAYSSTVNFKNIEMRIEAIKR